MKSKVAIASVLSFGFVAGLLWKRKTNHQLEERVKANEHRLDMAWDELLKLRGNDGVR